MGSILNILDLMPEELPGQPSKFTINTSSGRDVNSRKNSSSTPAIAETMTTAGTRETPMALKT
jgi:hypothetical protein